MRLSLMLSMLVLSGCAGPEVRPEEYLIPVIKADQTVERFTVEPEPGETERMLFCMEMPGLVLCVAEKDGRAVQHMIPQPEPPPLFGPPAEAGT